MNYSRLHRFKGSQKVHKGSQQNVNPLCEPYNKHKVLYINKLHITNDNLCEAYVNPLKYTTLWYSGCLAYFVNPYTIFNFPKIISKKMIKAAYPIPCAQRSFAIEDWTLNIED